MAAGGVAIAGLSLWGNFQPKGLLIAENLCLPQQLVVLQRRHPRPYLRNAYRRFWILASRWFRDWRNPLRLVDPAQVGSRAVERACYEARCDSAP